MNDKSLMPFQVSLLFFPVAISWYERMGMQEVIVQGVQQGVSVKGTLHRYNAMCIPQSFVQLLIVNLIVS